MLGASSRGLSPNLRRRLAAVARAVGAACVIFAVVVALLFELLSTVAPRGMGSGWREQGVLLGMPEAVVTREFVDAPGGTWERRLDCSDGFALEWHRSDARVPTRWARFEFHAGALVAVRMHVDRSPVPAAELTRSEARQERAYEGGFRHHAAFAGLLHPLGGSRPD